MGEPSICNKTGARMKPLDEHTRGLLLSAAGTLADNFYETLSVYAHSQKQRFLLNLETGFFGTAVASYFYVMRYAKHANPTVFALDLFESYRVACIDSHKELDTAEERDALDHLLRRHGPTATEDYTRSLLVSAVSPIQVFDPLRGRYKGGEKSPSSGLDQIVSVLVSRLQDGSGLDFPHEAVVRMRTKAETDLQALIDSFKHFFG
jgi:hypothetical protein